MIEAAKVEVNINGKKNELMRIPENFDKAMKLFSKELENIDLFHGAITSSIAKCKKFNLRKINVIYKNSDAILDYYTNLISSLEKDTLEKNPDGSYTVIPGGSTAEEAAEKQAAFQTIKDNSALSNRSSFSSDL